MTEQLRIDFAPQYLSDRQLAERLTCSRSHVARLAQLPGAPWRDITTRPGRKAFRRWPLAETMAWIDRQRGQVAVAVGEAAPKQRAVDPSQNRQRFRAMLAEATK